MAFRVEKEEYVNRTFRFSKKHISLNRLTVQCIEYALSEMEEEPGAPPAPPLK